MAEFKALSICHPPKKLVYRVLLEKINSDWTAPAITGFHLLKGFERWKNLLAFKRHSAYAFLLDVIINSYIENEKAFWVNNATNLSPGFSPQEAIPSLIKVSTHCFLLISIIWKPPAPTRDASSQWLHLEFTEVGRPRDMSDSARRRLQGDIQKPCCSLSSPLTLSALTHCTLSGTLCSLPSHWF